MGDDASGLKAMVNDLVKIEVNTILTDRINGRKMPSVPHALLDVAGAYVDVLRAYGVDLNAVWDVAESRDEAVFENACGEKLAFGQRPAAPSYDNGWWTFARLRWIAAHLADGPPRGDDDVPDAARPMLNRICRNSDHLKVIVKPLESEPAWAPLIRKTRRELVEAGRRSAPELDVHALSQIRKIWEIGVEEIVCQTTLQLDGDVLTRLRRDLALEDDSDDDDDDDHLTETDLHKIMRVHERSVGLSVQYWRGVFETVASLMGVTIDRLFGRSGGG